jgi:hypothetical protein
MKTKGWATTDKITKKKNSGNIKILSIIVMALAIHLMSLLPFHVFLMNDGH